MTEEAFDKAWDIMCDRAKFKDQLELVNIFLNAGVENCDINEILRMSENLRTDIFIDIKSRLIKYAETLQTSIELCNERLEQL